MGSLKVSFVFLAIAAIWLIDSTQAQCTFSAPTGASKPQEATVQDSEADTLIWSFTLTHANTIDPATFTAAFTAENQGLIPYFDLDIIEDTDVATTLTLTTSEAFNNILDVAGFLSTRLSPAFTVTCGANTVTLPVANTILVQDTNNKAPEFVVASENTPTFPVNLATYNFEDAINTVAIRIQDRDFVLENANLDSLTVQLENGQHTNMVVLADRTLTMTPVPAEGANPRRFEKNIQLRLSAGVVAGNYAFRLAAEDQLGNKVYAPFNVAATGAVPNDDDNDDATEPNGAGQVEAVFMVTLASFITAWVNL